MQMYNFNNEKLQHYKIITDKLIMSTDNSITTPMSNLIMAPRLGLHRMWQQ